MKKINILELLKDCPQGMELDCTVYNDVTFLRIDEVQNRCYFKAGPADMFWTTCEGRINGSPFGKCVIFPKGKTTWEGFVSLCKFDITTLVSFESRVLVRDCKQEKWTPAIWGFYNNDAVMNYPYECICGAFAQCIPYEGNEHLLGTTDDCDEFYKTWK